MPSSAIAARLRRRLEAAIDAAEISHGAAELRRRTEPDEAALTRGVRTDSFFDLASLSKLATATLALVLEQRRRLPLRTEIGEIWPGANAALASRTLEDLLRHRSGLPAWLPIYARCQKPEDVAELLTTLPVDGGGGPLYSDLGYILWALSAARALGTSAWELLASEVLDPLELRREVSEAGDEPRVLPCLCDREREARLAAGLGLRITVEPPRAGQAQDGNAAFLGTYTGHAGLFASLRGVSVLVSAWGDALGSRDGLIEVDAAVGALGSPGGFGFALGWWTEQRLDYLSPAWRPAYGHPGFTGGSATLSADGAAQLVVLAHRLGSQVDLGPLRRDLHRLTMGRST